ncbi:MAG: YbaB/EbfC family nucleoid-associated protein [Alphaproteobacteria bacterium]
MVDIAGMMKQAQALQAKMQEAQADLERLESVGTAGGGLVSVTLNGKGVMQGLTIDPTLLKPEEGEILEDLITAAHNDARAKMETVTAEKMRAVTGGLQLPPGLIPGM